ncbi:MAG: hypothetical protein ACF8NJ_05080 [Phycisphaerales bacterium JB038]
MRCLNERGWLTGAAVFLSTLTVTAPAPARSNAADEGGKARNILLIISDDHGQDLGV